jgi:hypothetical protein
MAARNYYTPEEITLCAYAAMYDAADFGGERRIEALTHRSAGSIRMKIQNIAAMLDEARIRRESFVSPLTGRPPGESGRTTNWEQVEPLTRLPKAAFLERCQAIVEQQRNKASRPSV